MNCPKCGQPMIVLELDLVELDHCPACKGAWFDSGELDIVLEHRAPLHLASETESSERKIRCPRCRQKMAKAHFEHSDITIDTCQAGHGLWFDGGEIENLLTTQQIDPENRIYKLLKGIFKKQDKTKE